MDETLRGGVSASGRTLLQEKFKSFTLAIYGAATTPLQRLPTPQMIISLNPSAKVHAHTSGQKMKRCMQVWIGR